MSEKTYEDGVREERERIELLLTQIADENLMPRNKAWIQINVISLFRQLGLEQSN
jgi:hypothetical protein